MNNILKLIGLSIFSLFLILPLVNPVQAGYCLWPDNVWRECREVTQAYNFVKPEQDIDSNRNLRSNIPPNRRVLSNLAIVVVFKKEKAEFKDGYLHIWGTITNEGDSTLKWLKVKFTITSATGEFITKQVVNLDPFILEPNYTAYVKDAIIDCNGQIPVNVTWETVFRD